MPCAEVPKLLDLISYYIAPNTSELFYPDLFTVRLDSNVCINSGSQANYTWLRMQLSVAAIIVPASVMWYCRMKV